MRFADLRPHDREAISAADAARDPGRAAPPIEINMERVARAVYSGQSPPQRRSDKK